MLICTGNFHRLCKLEGCQKCFNRSFASSDKAKFWSDINLLTPREVCKSSLKKYWFVCGECNHSFDASLNNIHGCKTRKSRWCPYCSNPPKKLCEGECDACFKKSFASSDKAQFWSEKNGVKARGVFLTSNKKYWFDCNECGHCFDICISSIIKGQWCRYCTNQDLCKDEECMVCFNHSFASAAMAEFWSTKNEKEPRYATKGSGTKYWFDCNKCGHDFLITLNQIARGAWCPYCANQRLCAALDCIMCFERSFASYHRAKNWSKKNSKSSREVAKYSNLEYWFDCEDCGNDFKSPADRIAFQGSWCPVCKNKTEKELLKYLQSVFTVQHQARFEWAKNPLTSKILPYDFYIPSHNIIIELDGPQHFRQIGKWTSPEETRERDRLKEYLAIKNGLSIIRLLQEDVRDDKNNWEEKLLKAISYAQKEQHILHLYGDHIDDVSYVYEMVW